MPPFFFSAPQSKTRDRATSRGTTFLGLEPLPTLLEIAAMPEFEPVAITKDEFEAVWLKATAQV